MNQFALHRNIFAGGAVVDNTQPIVQLYGNLIAKKQAKDEALDQYYQNLHKGINPAGMRTIDINSGFSKKLDDWQKYYMDNKEAIKNPRTPEDRAKALQHESMHQDLLMDINKSKEKAAQELTLGKAKMAGNWNPTDQDMEVAHRIGQSIYSPDSYKDPQTQTQPYNLNDVSLNTPQFDPTKQQAFYKAATQGLTAGKTYDDKNARAANGYVYTPYEQSYTTDQLKTIGDRAGSLFQGDRSAQVHYEHLMHDPSFLIPANQAYQSVYGTKEIVDNPKKAAQAANIMAAQAERTTGEEPRKDEQAAFDRQKELAKYNHSLKLGEDQFREDLKNKSESTKALWLGQYLDDQTNKAKTDEFGKAKPMAFYDTGAGATAAVEIPLTTTLVKSFTKDGHKPDKLIYTFDNKYVPIYYVKDKDGNILDKNGKVTTDLKSADVSQTLSVPQDRNSTIVDMGGQVGVKQKNLEGAGLKSGNNYNIKGKQYSEKQLLDMGYTIDQIKQYKQ